MAVPVPSLLGAGTGTVLPPSGLVVGSPAVAGYGGDGWGGVAANLLPLPYNGLANSDSALMNKIEYNNGT